MSQTKRPATWGKASLLVLAGAAVLSAVGITGGTIAPASAATVTPPVESAITVVMTKHVGKAPQKIQPSKQRALEAPQKVHGLSKRIADAQHRIDAAQERLASTDGFVE